MNFYIIVTEEIPICPIYVITNILGILNQFIENSGITVIFNLIKMTLPVFNGIRVFQLTNFRHMLCLISSRSALLLFQPTLEQSR